VRRLIGPSFGSTRASDAMSTVEIDGFLSPELRRRIDECRSRHAAWFELLTRTNRFGQSLLKEVRIERNSLQQSIACLFYIRLLGHAQGAILLIERCMPAQSEVLCRATLETLFGLVAVVDRADTAQLLVRGDRHHQRRLLKATLRRGESIGAEAVQEAALVLDDVENDLARDPDPEMTTQCLAERAGLLASYDSAYKILSLSVHSNLRDLERQLSLDADGNPSTIKWGANFEGLDESLMLIADVLIRATTAICRLFNLGYQQELEAIRGSYAPLAATIVERPNQGLQPTA
jgi:Family of unknown function (DUF5677)